MEQGCHVFDTRPPGIREKVASADTSDLSPISPSSLIRHSHLPILEVKALRVCSLAVQRDLQNRRCNGWWRLDFLAVAHVHTQKNCARLQANTRQRIQSLVVMRAPSCSHPPRHSLFLARIRKGKQRGTETSEHQRYGDSGGKRCTTYLTSEPHT